MNQTESQYDGIQIRADPAIHEEAFRLISSYLKPPGRILDIAAGAGAFAARLRDAGYRVDANDIDVAGWRAKGLTKTAYDLNQPLAQELLAREPYDLVVAMEIIEHLENPKKLLRDCMGMLRPGGYIVLTTPNISNAFSRGQFLGRTHFNWFTPDAYASSGHMTVLPWWLLELLIQSVGLKHVQRVFAGYRVTPCNTVKGVILRCILTVLRPMMLHVDPEELTRNALIYVLQKPASS